MKASLINGKIEIDLQAIVESLSEDEKAEFFESIVFEEKLLQCFVDMMTGDYVFDSGLHSTTYSSSERVKTLAGQIRERLIPLMPDAHQTQMKELIAEADRQTEAASKSFNEKCEIERKYWNLMSDIQSGRVAVNGESYWTNKIERKASS